MSRAELEAAIADIEAVRADALRKLENDEKNEDESMMAVVEYTRQIREYRRLLDATPAAEATLQEPDGILFIMDGPRVRAEYNFATHKWTEHDPPIPHTKMGIPIMDNVTTFNSHTLDFAENGVDRVLHVFPMMCVNNVLYTVHKGEVVHMYDEYKFSWKPATTEKTPFAATQCRPRAVTAMGNHLYAAADGMVHVYCTHNNKWVDAIAAPMDVSALFYDKDGVIAIATSLRESGIIVGGEWKPLADGAPELDPRIIQYYAAAIVQWIATRSETDVENAKRARIKMLNDNVFPEAAPDED